MLRLSVLLAVSTLLEILPPGTGKSYAAKFFSKFQPLLRFYLGRFDLDLRCTVEVFASGEMLCVFQPFLRFYGSAL